MMWSNSVRSILKGWLGAMETPPGDDDTAEVADDESVFRRSSAVTMDVSLEAPPTATPTPTPPPPPPAAPEVVQGSKSYMDVSMSAKRMSSSARSVRNPADAEA